jgi:hypothetical protein
VSASGLFLTVGFAAASWAQVTPGPPDFGMVGLARGETARFSAVLVGNPDLYPPGPCRVRLGFVDAAGNAIRNRAGAPVAVVENLRRGHVVSVDLPSAEALGDGSVRKAIRAVLTDPPDPDFPPGPCDALMGTVEIFSNESGRTLLLQSSHGQHASAATDSTAPVSAPDPGFGMVGMIDSQTAVLSVAMIGNPDLTPPDPCRVSLGFLDAAGAAFHDRKGAAIALDTDITPGQSVSLRLRSVDAFAGFSGRRRAFRPVLADPPDPDFPAGACRNLSATVEVFDNASGRTRVLYPLAVTSQAAPPR